MDNITNITPTEEEFLYHLNLSKCEIVPNNSNITVKKQINTRSKSKLRFRKSACLFGSKTLFSNTSTAWSIAASRSTSTSGKKVKASRYSKKISCLKAANLKDLHLVTKNSSSISNSSVDNRQCKRNKNLLNADNVYNDISTVPVTGFCRICRRAYSSKADRVEHFKSAAHIVNAEAKKGTNYEALKEESDVFKNVKFPSKCSICGEGPFGRREFLVHHRRHAGVQPYHCDRCKNKYYRRCDLLGHLRSHLGANQRFKCPKCPRVFTKQSSVTTHLIVKHSLADTRPRNYKCTECGRAFLTKQDVDRHMQTHTGHIPARCGTCGKGFSSLHALQQHQRMHSGETPFKCEQCSYVSKSRQALVKHQRKHSGEKPFKCPLCAFVCSQSSGLKRHMVKHSATKPYQCPYCKYRCSNIENLRKHVKKTQKHKGLNVYPCKHCDFSTDSSSDYLKHLKKLHIPNLDEDNSSATKLSGIFVSEEHNELQKTTSSITGSAEEPHTIEMVIVSDSNACNSNNSISASHSCVWAQGTDKLQPEDVSALDEVFLNAIIKIPNLRQVILPPGIHLRSFSSDAYQEESSE